MFLSKALNLHFSLWFGLALYGSLNWSSVAASDPCSTRRTERNVFSAVCVDKYHIQYVYTVCICKQHTHVFNFNCLWAAVNSLPDLDPIKGVDWNKSGWCLITILLCCFSIFSNKTSRLHQSGASFHFTSLITWSCLWSRRRRRRRRRPRLQGCFQGGGGAGGVSDIKKAETLPSRLAGCLRYCLRAEQLKFLPLFCNSKPFHRLGNDFPSSTFLFLHLDWGNFID